jgi:hypothetical protein
MQEMPEEEMAERDSTSGILRFIGWGEYYRNLKTPYPPECQPQGYDHDKAVEGMEKHHLGLGRSKRMGKQ